MGDLAYALKNAGKNMEDCPIPSASIAALIRAIDSGKISGKIAKTVLRRWAGPWKDPDVIIQRLGLAQVSDETSLGLLVDKIVAANQKQLAEFHVWENKSIRLFRGPGDERNTRSGESTGCQRSVAEKLSAD